MIYFIIKNEKNSGRNKVSHEMTWPLIIFVPHLINSVLYVSKSYPRLILQLPSIAFRISVEFHL